MFKEVSKISYTELLSLKGKSVRFISDCEIFPNFDVSGKVLSLEFNNNENIFVVKTNGKIIHIGSNMKNLRLEYLSE